MHRRFFSPVGTKASPCSTAYGMPLRGGVPEKQACADAACAYVREDAASPAAALHGGVRLRNRSVRADSAQTLFAFRRDVSGNAAAESGEAVFAANKKRLRRAAADAFRSPVFLRVEVGLKDNLRGKRVDFPLPFRSGQAGDIHIGIGFHGGKAFVDEHNLGAGLFGDKRRKAARPLGAEALRAVHIPRQADDHRRSAEPRDRLGGLLRRVRQPADLQRADRAGQNARRVAFGESDARVSEIHTDKNHFKISFLIVFFYKFQLLIYQMMQTEESFRQKL